MQHEHSIDTTGPFFSGRNQETDQAHMAAETARKWPWAEAGRHYDWMDRHLPFEHDASLNGI